MVEFAFGTNNNRICCRYYVQNKQWISSSNSESLPLSNGIVWIAFVLSNCFSILNYRPTFEAFLSHCVTQESPVIIVGNKADLVTLTFLCEV